MKQTLGEFIKKERLKKDMALEYFELKGISKSQMSRLENDKHIPKFETLLKVSSILRINILEILVEAGYVSNEIIDKYVAERDKKKK